MHPKSVGILCVIAGTFCFASKGILIKLAYLYGISATPLLTLRMLFALPFYLATALWLNRSAFEPFQKGDIWKIISLGLLGYYVSSLLDFLGLQYISAGLERLILYIYPTLVLLMLAYWKHERINNTVKLALAIAYGGMLLVFAHDLRLAKNIDLTLLGALLVFCSTISFALFIVLAGNMIKKVGSTRFTAYGMIAACSGVLAHGLSFGAIEDLQQPQPVYLLAIALAFFCTVIPSFLMNKGISLVGSGNAALIGSIGPIITLFLGALVLHETITSIQLIGAGLVIGGVSLATAKK
ncbi:EamA/RhaT family transporter [Cellvibrio sp. KY-GH-1]|uniref:DMT family transporter n=1 Tax=Cellvibrio sp. KY-GH-1 TaxID=2303332 RepID=UPI00124553DB|nr:EamA family transporter [Cellvibrio sp. KY-GH-1]QEY18801.1 EamA/RhaT family transporter [Cellvibrio sp. KY-GH-1]